MREWLWITPSRGHQNDMDVTAPGGHVSKKKIQETPSKHGGGVTPSR